MSCLECGADINAERLVFHAKFCSLKCQDTNWKRENKSRINMLRRFNKSVSKTTWRLTRRRHWLDKYKLACGCELCGYNNAAIALQFDHIDPATKEHPHFGNLIRLKSGIKAIIAELRKCRILCANCHAIHTDWQRKNKMLKTRDYIGFVNLDEI